MSSNSSAVFYSVTGINNSNEDMKKLFDASTDPVVKPDKWGLGLFGDNIDLAADTMLLLIAEMSELIDKTQNVIDQIAVSYKTQESSRASAITNTTIK